MHVHVWVRCSFVRSFCVGGQQRGVGGPVPYVGVAEEEARHLVMWAQQGDVAALSDLDS